MSSGVFEGRTLMEGRAAGPVVLLTEPLSLWGGMDPATGRIIDRRHPQAGLELSGRVLVMPAAKGSTSSSSTLAEAIRRGTAPAAIVLGRSDPILLIGAEVARELYGRTIPIVAVDPVTYQYLLGIDYLSIDANIEGAHLIPSQPHAP